MLQDSIDYLAINKMDIRRAIVYKHMSLLLRSMSIWPRKNQHTKK